MRAAPYSNYNVNLQSTSALHPDDQACSPAMVMQGIPCRANQNMLVICFVKMASSPSWKSLTT